MNAVGEDNSGLGPSNPIAAQSRSRRCYKVVTIGHGEGGYFVRLDGRDIRTPARRQLVLPSRALAQAMAREWEHRDGAINYAHMPLTRLANAALDHLSMDAGPVIAEIVNYADSDLLCYRACRPDELARRQSQAWDPVLNWATRALGINLVTTVGIVHRPQNKASLERLEERLRASDVFTLAGLHGTTMATGSALIALALGEGVLTPEKAWTIAHIDENWQSSHWGHDVQAQTRHAARQAEFKAIARLLALVGQDHAPMAGP